MEAYLIPIRRWADDSRFQGISTKIVDNTIQLAKGRLSIAIILLEPIADEGSFEGMLQRCGTLREIDALIRHGSGGLYCLKDVTILDIRILLSKRTMEQFSLTEADLEAAYDVVQEVIQMKRPEVILNLQCQTSRAKNTLARELCSRFSTSVSVDTLDFHDHEAFLVRGFHPSTYLNYAKDREERDQLRGYLQDCFKMAFQQLAKEGNGVQISGHRRRSLSQPITRCKASHRETRVRPQLGVNIVVRLASTTLQKRSINPHRACNLDKLSPRKTM